MTESRVTAFGYTIRVDKAATRAAHEKRRPGALECGCADCLWFDAHREELLPTAFRTFLTQLGIDPDKETEVTANELENTISSMGWYHANGEVVEGPEKGFSIPLATSDQKLWRIVNFAYRVQNRSDVAPANFPKPMVQVDFYATYWRERPNWWDRLKIKWWHWRGKL
jgi:hypothetical protein